MIDRSTLEGLATARSLVVLLVRGTNIQTTARVVFLWHSPPTEHTAYQRDDAWRVLVYTPEGYEAGLIFAGDADFIRLDGYVMPAIDLAAPILGTDRTRLIEAALLAAHLGLRVGFRYGKVAGGPVEVRRGQALGVRGMQLLIADADRGNATRGFRFDRMDLLQPLDFVPRWDGHGYAMPVATDGGGTPCPV